MTVIRTVKRSIWHDSNESRCFVPLMAHKHYIEHLLNSSYRFIEENDIAIIIVIQLPPSPRQLVSICLALLCKSFNWLNYVKLAKLGYQYLSYLVTFTICKAPM